jgi:RsiW-degrading membrane proteinase PrsW (M82 family)
MEQPGKYLLVSGDGRTRHLLDLINTVALGRESNCQIVIDEKLYPGVSRRHAEIRPLNYSGAVVSQWEVCDLNSSNGTYVNGQRLTGCKILAVGDRLRLDSDGPEFIFRLDGPSGGVAKSSPAAKPMDRPMASPQPPRKPEPVAAASNPVNRHAEYSDPDASASGQSSIVRLDQLFPVMAHRRELLQKAYLVPGIFTVLLVVSLFASLGKPGLFNFLLAVYISGMAFYFVYQTCGKKKPWWVLVCSGLITMLILITPLIDWLYRTVYSHVLRGWLDGRVA